jgi:PAS domain S-box-containing protein
MKQVLFSIFLVALVFFSVDCFTQIQKKGIPYINNYTIDDYSPEGYRASPQNWEIYQDSSGILYFGNTDGILIYDGANWRFKFLPNRSTVRSITGYNNNLYVGGESEFGKFIRNSNGKLEYSSYISLLPDTLKRVRNIWEIFTYNDSIVFQGRNKLYIFKNDQLIDIIKTKFQFFYGFKHNDQLFFFEAGRGMTRLIDGATKLVPDGDFYKNHTPRAVFSLNEDSLLLASPIDGFAFYDGSEFSPWDIPLSDFIIENQLYSGSRISNDLFALGTQNAGLVFMNRQGEVQQMINKENGLQNNMVFDMKIDSHGNLWLALANGISFLNLNSPFRYYTESVGIPRQNYYVVKHGKNLYFSNDAGVYSKPWKDISQNITINKAHLLENSKGQSWLFKKVDDYLLCGHNRGVLVIKNNEIKDILPIASNVWEIIEDPFKEDLYLACSMEGIYYLRNNSKGISVRNKLKGFDENISYSAFDSTGHLWVSNEINGVFRLKISENRDTVLKINHYTEEDGLPLKDGNWVFRFDDQMVITNTNHYGIYRYEPMSDSIKPYSKLNRKFQIEGAVTLLRKGPLGNCWIRDKGLVKMAKPLKNENSVQLIKKPFKKFKNRNLERISFIDSVYTFFGTDEYVLNYCRKYDYNLSRPYSAHIRRIISMHNDSIIYFGNSVEKLSGSDSSLKKEAYTTLSYDQNALRFEFSATFFDEPDKLQYKAWLEGYEDVPNNWSSETNKEYTNLHEGDYIFHVKAKNVYNQNSKEAVYHFKVTPPWYRTVLAYVLYVLAFLIVIYLSVRLYVRKLKADKEKLEYLVQERTAEINQQKDEIQAQAEELTRVNKELQKLSLVASKTDNAVMISDEKGQIEWINEGFTRLFGYSLTELNKFSKSNISNVIPEVDLSSLSDYTQKSEESVVYESEVLTKNNNTLYIQTTLTPILAASGSVDRFIAISTDISQLKATEKKLQKLVATKDKFFSIIAHDLKNPFHSIMGISELLSSDEERYSREKIKELHSHLYKVANQGYQLLTNLLEWARSQTGRLDFKFESVKLYDLVEESFELLSSSFQQKNLSMENLIEEDLYIWADRNTIKTVLRNLISNAVKYTPSGGYVRVYNHYWNGQVEVFVEDNGVGISPEDLDKLFRVDTNYTTKGTDEEGGTGLGLILCKEFVEKNGGELKVDSILEGGSTFSFTVKRA